MGTTEALAPARRVEPWADWQKPVEPGDVFAYGAHLGPKNPKLRALYNDKGEKIHGALVDGEPASTVDAIMHLARTSSGGLPPEISRTSGGGVKIAPRPRPPARRWIMVQAKAPGGARPRQSRGCNTRARGSRRSSSAARAGPDDDPGPLSPSPGRRGQGHHLHHVAADLVLAGGWGR